MTAPDLLLILRDALASSLIGGLLLATKAKEAGQEVAVVFTQEALAAITLGSFEWPRELSGERMRQTMADRGAEDGLPLVGRGEGRQLDAKGLLSKASGAGVAIYACPVWSSMLEIEDSLPPDIQPLDTPGVLTLIQQAKRVVGSL